MSRVKRPLNRSIILVCALFIGLLCVVLSVATYRLYTTTMYDRYQKQLASILTYIESYIDHDDMAECADTFVESEKYREDQTLLDRFIDTYEDVHYLYIMKVADPDDPVGIYVVCTANSTYEKEQNPDDVLHLGDGEEGWYDEETTQGFREILQGDEDVYYVNPSAWGVDYTLARPLKNSKGEHYGLLCADVSIDEINKTVYRNIYINIAMIVVPGLLFILLLILWMRANVTRPLKQLENSVTAFAGASTGRRDPDDLVFVPPEIHTHSEVESLTQAVTKLSADMRDYVKDIVEAENEAKGLQEHVTEMNTIAFQDALTHVKNRASYDEMAQSLSWDIVNNCAEFAIVMVDLNSLKVINDQYGHDKGNEYIVGACKVICDVYVHSPVFRVGGDEFVVVLQGQDYRNREALLEKVRDGFSKALSERGQAPWHRYSAAVGMATYAPGEDLETVFNRADQDMYETKARMKAEGAEPEQV